MKESNVIQDDNFLKSIEILDVKDRVLKQGFDIPWTLAYNTDIPIPGSSYENSYQFAAGLNPQMPSYNYFLQVFNAFCTKNNLDYKEITRMKLNWLPRVSGGGEGSHTPHIDSKDPHRVFLYYINDSDGDTVFFDEVYSGDSPKEFNELLRISPKAGRGVVFDGHTYHASSSPSNSEYRCILNVDFV